MDKSSVLAVGRQVANCGVFEAFDDGLSAVVVRNVDGLRESV